MNNFKSSKGSIDLIMGPMFSGKTEELIRKINRASYANLETIIFKPEIDNRSRNSIKSRTNQGKKAIEILDPFEIYEYLKKLKKQPDVIAIDEVQFFDITIVEVINELSNSGYIVLVSGLDLDFRGEPFEITAKLACLAENVTKLSAICTKCYNPGTITQRFINNLPPDYSAPVILIGNTESYTVRCRKDHQVLNKKKSIKTESFLQYIKNNE